MVVLGLVVAVWHGRIVRRGAGSPRNGDGAAKRRARNTFEPVSASGREGVLAETGSTVRELGGRLFPDRCALINAARSRGLRRF
ncbi:hypothetical protein GCM10011584_16970 [Nocardioides phosphati]|uniref:Uncharacterized protein n=1 Tax=Nocardioides phosphati TaxID=1867775 RepID=A0ABQ2NBG2_9ACTN|nr:hypothetical protein GCM10011584_16970 [Nocardioides phosphati]